jgi:nucleoside-diphosphate-sugar epimerase
MSPLVYFVSGASGLLGRAVIDRLLRDPRVTRVYGLSRAPAVAPVGRLIPLSGDVRVPGMGLTAGLRARLAAQVNVVVHLAAATSFSQPLDEARATNTDGTRHLLEMLAGWSGVRRLVHASTAFVAGARTGRIGEDDTEAPPAWINAYEQSKYEAETLVRASGIEWVIARPATIVCDDVRGRISQVNAVHRALRLYFGGLAAMLPSAPSTALDLVTTAYVADGFTRLTLAPGVAGRTYHLCAGAGAMDLGELLEATYRAFAHAPAWRRKGIARPERVDLETYRLFERAIEDAGSSRVRQAVRSLSHFVPQLAHPKVFDTAGADAVLGRAAPPVAAFWDNMVATLVGATCARAVA